MRDLHLRDSWHHLLAGGAGGMMGAVVTSPLEVVKTRSNIFQAMTSVAATTIILVNRFQSSGGQALYTATGAAQAQVVRYSRIWSTLSQIVMQEGARGLFKGLGPTLLGETWRRLSTVTVRHILRFI